MTKRRHKLERLTPEEERRRDALLIAPERLGVQIDRTPGKPPRVEDTLPGRIQDFIQDLPPRLQEETIRRALGLVALQVAPALGAKLPGDLPGRTWSEKWQCVQERLSQCPAPEAFAAGVRIGWAFGRVAAGILSGEDSRRGAHGRPRKPGPLKWALTQVAVKIGSWNKENVLNALRNEDLIEDLFCSTDDDRIDLHLFELEADGYLSATDRQGQGCFWRLRTVQTYLASLRP